jgi:hypothetical protein
MLVEHHITAPSPNPQPPPPPRGGIRPACNSAHRPSAVCTLPAGNQWHPLARGGTERSRAQLPPSTFVPFAGSSLHLPYVQLHATVPPSVFPLSWDGSRPASGHPPPHTLRGRRSTGRDRWLQSATHDECLLLPKPTFGSGQLPLGGVPPPPPSPPLTLVVPSIATQGSAECTTPTLSQQHPVQCLPSSRRRRQRKPLVLLRTRRPVLQTRLGGVVVGPPPPPLPPLRCSYVHCPLLSGTDSSKRTRQCIFCHYLLR